MQGLGDADSRETHLCSPIVQREDPEWAAAIERNELALLQLHICRALSVSRQTDSGLSAGNADLSRAVMRAWVKQHAEQLCGEMAEFLSGEGSPNGS